MKYSETEKKEALDRLRSWLRPGDTVRTILRHVSRSGMFRRISLIKFDGDREICLDYNVETLLGIKHTRCEGVSVSGCGMDMGFHLVYSLSSALWPNGFTCIGKKCHSNDHFNGDRNYRRHHHHSGGYALNHKWL